MRTVFLFFCCFTFIACQKEALQHETDIQLIKQYLIDSNITAIENTEANFFYQLKCDSSETISPVRNSKLKLKLKYKAFLLDGTLLHDSNGIEEIIEMDETIFGWQLALELMHRNDTMLLLLPSRLAYGETGTADVPPNSVMRFDIELIDIFPHF
ncbi:MAG: FKBP-type peptidyl-prolyl cis-trans isomerase [Saprospiraceae bacterium]|nr:FKBP-type peptidyl-prolyl cis-trans isomerase [Saprospiraceae bacterium]